MQETTPREKVLKKIRNALISKTDNPFPSLDQESSVYPEMPELPDVTFAQEFVSGGGKFIYCETQADLEQNITSLFREKNFSNIFCIDEEVGELLQKTNITFKSDTNEIKHSLVGVTTCEYLIARTGSILVSSKQSSGRRLNVFPETHIVVAHTGQIVNEISEALVAIQNKYGADMPSMISMITGPSRTADIEKTLVMGAHGPKELYLFLIDK